MSPVYINSFETSWGRINTAAVDDGLVFISLPGSDNSHFEHQIARLFPNCRIERGGALNEQAEEELTAYLSGKLREFTVKLHLNVTPFQKQVLDKVAAIPYGKTRTYGDIAAELGKPNASRAVGSANGRNPLPLVIPCHRVVAAAGLGGYGGGLNMKRKLLEMEGAFGASVYRQERLI